MATRVRLNYVGECRRLGAFSEEPPSKRLLPNGPGAVIYLYCFDFRKVAIESLNRLREEPENCLPAPAARIHPPFTVPRLLGVRCADRTESRQSRNESLNRGAHCAVYRTVDCALRWSR